MLNSSDHYGSAEEEGRVSLRDFLTYENPKIAEYRELMRQNQQEGSRMEDGFAMQWSEILYNPGSNDSQVNYNPSRWEVARDYFKEKLSGGVLIDVGGNTGNQIDTMRAFAKKFGARTYIDVDLMNGGPPDPFTAVRANESQYLELPPEERIGAMDEYLVTADMLDFVSRLPDNSCNFAENGIDQYILGTGRNGTEYGKALFREMIRATRVGGIIFGIESDMWGNSDPRLKDMTESLGFRKGGWGNRHQIYEKIKE